jgi:hypothetical protein
MALPSAPHWSYALVLLALGCSGSSHTATPAPVAPVSTAPIADAGEPMAEDVPATPAEPVVVDAGGPVAEAPLPPMPTGLHGPARPWARLTAQEKGAYMHDTVLPAMTALLQAYDPAHFTEVTCATCHGANARAVHFHMPNGIAPLPAFGTPAAQERMARQHRTYEFMGTRMLPAMAQLLGQQPYNPQTHQGFGCFNCHGHEAAGGDAGAATPAAH